MRITGVSCLLNDYSVVYPVVFHLVSKQIYALNLLHMMPKPQHCPAGVSDIWSCSRDEWAVRFSAWISYAVCLWLPICRWSRLHTQKKKKKNVYMAYVHFHLINYGWILWRWKKRPWIDVFLWYMMIYIYFCLQQNTAVYITVECYWHDDYAKSSLKDPWWWAECNDIWNISYSQM